MVANFNP